MISLDIKVWEAQVFQGKATYDGLTHLPELLPLFNFCHSLNQPQGSS